MTPRTHRERVEAIWRKKLQEAEEAYGVAFSQTRKLQAELESMPPSDGMLALEKALTLQNQAMNDYVLVLQTFTRLILYGEMPEETVAPPPADLKPTTDLDIQEWVYRHHAFVPHPVWIAHCRALYLGAQREERSQECPLDKRLAIRDAFVAFGLLPK